MKNKDLISIIVPVYNVADYLVDCLESIINQTYLHLEIIIIDDGSTDSSHRICDYYALKDKRINVFHQPNKGLGPARNKGISMARGKYISFVDSDDYIHPRAIELLYESIQIYETDLAIGNFKKVSKFILPKYNIDYDTYVLSQNELIKCFYGSKSSQYNVLQDINFTSVWSKLYRKDLLDNILFRNMYYEDVDFNMAVFLRLNKVSYINIPLYYWLQRRSSITHEPMNKRRLDILSAYKYSIDRIPLSENTYRGIALLRFFKLMLSVKLQYEKSICKTYAYELIKNLDKEYRKEFFSNTTISWKDKMGVYILFGNPTFYRLFIKLSEVLSKYNLHIH